MRFGMRMESSSLITLGRPSHCWAKERMKFVRYLCFSYQMMQLLYPSKPTTSHQQGTQKIIKILIWSVSRPPYQGQLTHPPREQEYVGSISGSYFGVN